MEKIKDFIYDKSDLVVALLILVIAAVIIFWRMGVILDYPKTLLSSETTQVEDADQGDSSSQDEGDAAADTQTGDTTTEDGDAVTDDTAADDTAADDSTADDAAADDQTSTALYSDGKLTKDVTVDMEGSTALEAIGCLVNAGLFESYDEYKSLCTAQGLNDEKVSAGEVTFTAGMTKEQIAKKVNWS